jgi:hypothetical protein
LPISIARASIALGATRGPRHRRHGGCPSPVATAALIVRTSTKAYLSSSLRLRRGCPAGGSRAVALATMDRPLDRSAARPCNNARRPTARPLSWQTAPSRAPRTSRRSPRRGGSGAPVALRPAPRPPPRWPPPTLAPWSPWGRTIALACGLPPTVA